MYLDKGWKKQELTSPLKGWSMMTLEYKGLVCGLFSRHEDRE